MDAAVTTRVIARNGIGQFLAACERGSEETIKEAIKRGERLSKTMAPEGHKDDPRTVPLKQAMFSKMTGRTSGYWGNFARHALPIEFGAGPHDIPANVSFYWEKMGRMWMHPADYLRMTGYPGADPIRHPGNPAQPYLRPAYKSIMAQIMSIAREKFPG